MNGKLGAVKNKILNIYAVSALTDQPIWGVAI
jgi:hypothetical protein